MHDHRILVILLFCLLFVGCSPASESIAQPSTRSETAMPTSLPEEMSQPVTSDFTARFEISTNGTKRIFTEAKYHNRSPDVYIESPDPNMIHVKKPNLTWDDFFRTLPFSLTKDCLITGTKQTFCSSETKTLRFLLNSIEDPDALDKVIAPNDMLRVEYR